MATITRIDEKCNAQTVSIVNFNRLERGMVLCPGFDSEVLPLAIGLDERGRYEMADIRGKGWVGNVAGLEDVDIIGQPPQKPNWIFVKSRKSGALGILDMK